MTALQYTRAVLMFSAAGFLVLYIIQRIQGHLPFNPISLKGVRPDIAMNTSISFVTNTNWQAYVPETTVSYLTQFAGLAVQNFVSAATGMAVAVAMVRGFTHSNRNGIGNFWADLVRGTLYILIPLALIIGGRARRTRQRHDVRRPGARQDARGRRADDHARPRREPGRDQAARHERRRVLQRELGAPVRVGHAVHRLPAHRGAAADPVLVPVPVRPDARPDEGGARDPRGDADPDRLVATRSRWRPRRARPRR